MFRALCVAALVAGWCFGGGASQAADAAKKERDPAKFFDKKDANSDGFLTLDEFKAGMPEKAAGKAGARFAKIDVNGDSKVSRDEFKAGMEKAAKRKKP